MFRSLSNIRKIPASRQCVCITALICQRPTKKSRVWAECACFLKKDFPYSQRHVLGLADPLCPPASSSLSPSRTAVKLLGMYFKSLDLEGGQNPGVFLQIHVIAV